MAKVRNIEAYERVMPQNPEIEQAVLGAVMLDPDKLPAVLDIIGSESFYLDQHKFIFQAFIDLHQRGHKPDLPAVIDHLKQKGLIERIGGAGFVASLLSAVPTAAHAEHHAALVAEKYKLRQLIQICTQIVDEVYSQEIAPNDLMDWAGKAILEVVAQTSDASDPTLTELVDDAIMKLSTGGEELFGEPLPDWAPDGMTKAIVGGIQPGSLIVIQAPSSKGKSTFAAQYAYSTAAVGRNVLFVSREEGRMNAAARAIAHYVGRPWGSLLAFPERWEAVKHGLPSWLAEHPERFRFILDCARWAGIRRRAMSHHRENPIGLFVLDYLQRMQVDESRRVQEMENIAHGMKDLAVDLGCIAMLVTQENKAGTAKWSTAVYEAADHYWILKEKSGSDKTDTERKMILDITKNKNGPCWAFPLFWHPAIFWFMAESRKKK